MYAFPLKSERFNHEVLSEFIAQVGVPQRIHFDNAKSQVSKAWRKIFRRWSMRRHTIEPHHQNQNGVERMVQIVKQRTSYMLELFNTLVIYWCYALMLMVICFNRTGLATHNYKTSYKVEFGKTPDISCLKFQFY